MKRILALLLIVAVLVTSGLTAEAARKHTVINYDPDIIEEAVPEVLGVSAGFTFTRDLTVGSTGADVVELQTFLEAKGFLIITPGIAKGYFGATTKAALAQFQASLGLYPADGFFGPLTRDVVNGAGDFEEAVTLGFVSSSVNVDSNDPSQATFNIKFKATANFQDEYVKKNGAVFEIHNSSGPVDSKGQVGGSNVEVTSSFIMTTGAEEEKYSYLIEEGETATFILQVTVKNIGNTAGSFRLVFKNILASNRDSVSADDYVPEWDGVTEKFKTNFVQLSAGTGDNGGTGTIGKIIPTSTFYDFGYTIGDEVGSAYYQQLQLVNSSQTNVSIKVSVKNQPAWLNTGYTKEAITLTPGNVVGYGVSVNPKGLKAGVYKTELTFTGNFTGSPLRIPVTLKVYSDTVSDSGKIDLEIKKLFQEKSSDYPYSMTMNVCVHGSKSINDLKSEIGKLTGFPFVYYVYDSQGNSYSYPTYDAGGSIEDMKNGDCQEIGFAIQREHALILERSTNKNVKVFLDNQSLIKESNESNNTMGVIFKKTDTNQKTTNITLTYPNGGEIIGLGEKDKDFRVTWDSKGLKGDVGIYIHYADGATCYVGSANVNKKSFTARLGANYQCPNIPRIVSNGSNYKVSLYVNNKGDVNYATDSSDGFLSFISYSTAEKPEIIINPPKGGEQVKVGEQVYVGWQAKGLNPTSKSLRVYLYHPEYGYFSERSITGALTKGKGAGDLGLVTKGLKPGQYRVSICDDNTDSPTAPGKPFCVNGNYFTLVAAGTPSVENHTPRIDMVRGKAADNFEIFAGESTGIEGINLVYAGKDAEVYVGTTKAAIIQYNESILYFTTPKLNAGIYDLHVKTSYGKSNKVKVTLRNTTPVTGGTDSGTDTSSESTSDGTSSDSDLDTSITGSVNNTQSFEVIKPSSDTSVKAGAANALKVRIGNIKNIVNRARGTSYLIAPDGTETKLKEAYVYYCINTTTCSGYRSEYGVSGTVPATATPGSGYQVRVDVSYNGVTVSDTSDSFKVTN